MLNSCGYTVFSSSTSRSFFERLSTYTHNSAEWAEYKSSTYTLLFTHISRYLSHSIFTHLTAVKFRVIPTIHTTNKNYKNFYLNKSLLIYRKAVHK